MVERRSQSAFAALAENTAVGAVPSTLPRAHAARLRHYWRSQGWACFDAIDIDLLRWGLVSETVAPGVAHCLVLTDAGRSALVAAVTRNRRSRSRHVQATEDVAEQLSGQGRLVFTELSVRTELEGRWRPCKPDVFSLIPGLRADHLSPIVHEIKVSRADLLGELRTGKIERYRELAAAIYLVLANGIAEPEEIPCDYGVAVWRAAGPDANTAPARIEIVRAAPVVPCTLQVRHWMALARARPFVATASSPQGCL